MNYFSPKSAAQRYAQGRPYFHPLIVRRIKETLSLGEPLTAALDVGCGTGLSTIALKEIAQNVVGADAAAEMVMLAPKEIGVAFLVALAEQLPFAAGAFDLITLSQSFHWLDRDKFLAEAQRVLRPEGWLVAYDNYFSLGEMNEEPEFQRWHEEKYLERYPPPPRAKLAFAAEDTIGHGYRLVQEERPQNYLRFSPEGLIDYLVTQSNVIAAVENGTEEIAETREWLAEGIRPLFGNTEEKDFLFSAPIWYLQRLPT